jgi:hypothetical protein
MFEWLEQEILEIKTPRFHVVDDPVDPRLQDIVVQSQLALPASYKEFVVKFGNAKLYRRSRNGYQIGVFGGPREATLNDGLRIYHLGFHDGASVYVKSASNSIVFPIFECEADSREKVADDFEEWLTASCAHARSTYSGEKWAGILSGPEPFTSKEKEVIETRRQIQWQVLGIDSVGNHIIEVMNSGCRRIPVLTVGARSTNGRLNGAILLQIGAVGPGQTTTLHVDCYRDLAPPREIELFALPDPEPEDREWYGKFGRHA